MTSSMSRTTKYVYRSSGGVGGNVEMEYGTDLGAFTRLEVSHISRQSPVDRSPALNEASRPSHLLHLHPVQPACVQSARAWPRLTSRVWAIAGQAFRPQL